MSRICSQMSWSPRPLSSSLGGRFLGGSSAAGLLLHHPLIVPNRCVMRHLRVRVGDGLGDLAPIGCKAESCGFGQVLYVCYVLPLCPSRRLLGDVDAERKEITAPRHLIVSFREEPCIDLHLLSHPLSHSFAVLQCQVRRLIGKGAAPMVQLVIPEAPAVVTDTITMTNKLHIADIVLLLQACIPSTTSQHPLSAPC